jgi:hypothetical protein
MLLSHRDRDETCLAVDILLARDVFEASHNVAPPVLSRRGREDPVSEPHCALRVDRP